MTPAANHLLRALYLHALAPSTANQDAVRAAGAALDTETARKLNGPRSPAPVDSIVAEVRADLLARSEVGIAKYGVTLDRTDLGLREWLVHFREELMDGVLYATRALRDLRPATLRRPGRDDEADAIEAGIEAAAEAVVEMSPAWGNRELQIARAAATAAVQGLWERMTDAPCDTPAAAPAEPPTADRHDAEDAIEAGCHAASGGEAEWGAREQRIALTAAREAVYNFLERVTAGTTATAPVEPPHASAPLLAPLAPEPAEAVLGRAGEALAGSLPVYVLAGTGRHPYGDDAWHMETDGVARLFPSKDAAQRWLAAMGKAA